MTKRITALMLAFSFIISVLCVGVAAQAEVIHENELEDYIMQEMSAANILGVGISIVNSEKELYCAAFGAASETESDYVLGALSQSFTAAGIMRIIEDGDLALTDTVSDYLPEYKEVADVTIQELLYQTSGITMEQRMSDLSAEGERGEFQFANANYNLLGKIIEKVSEMTYEEYISDNILDALDMTSTYSLRMDSDSSGELLTGFRSYFGFPYASLNQYDADDDWLQPSSGYMISDIKDMGKYLQMYLKEGGDVLSKASVNMMLYDGVDVPSDNIAANGLFDGSAKYGMGWLQKEVKGKTILYHTGIAENFTTLMVLLPEQDMGITMMFNSMDYLVGQKLIQSLEEGVISIELEETPSTVDSQSYLMEHGIYDAIMLIAVIASWMPIFLVGGWIKRRKKKLLFIPGLIVDILIQIGLPTALLVYAQSSVPVFLVKRYVPDVYYVGVVVIASLYLGGLIKLISGIVLAVLKSKNVLENAEEEAPEETDEERSIVLGKDVAVDNKVDAKVKMEKITEVKGRENKEKAEDSEKPEKVKEEKAEKTEEDVQDKSEKTTEKAGNSTQDSKVKKEEKEEKTAEEKAAESEKKKTKEQAAESVKKDESAKEEKRKTGEPADKSVKEEKTAEETKEKAKEDKKAVVEKQAKGKEESGRVRNADGKSSNVKPAAGKPTGNNSRKKSRKRK